MKSQVLFEDQHYVACWLKCNLLTVQNKRRIREGKMTGASLAGAEAAEFRDAFMDEMGDNAEKRALCRAVLGGMR